MKFAQPVPSVCPVTDPLKSVRCFKCGCFGHRGNQCSQFLGPPLPQHARKYKFSLNAHPNGYYPNAYNVPLQPQPPPGMATGASGHGSQQGRSGSRTRKYSSYNPAPNDGLEKCWICGCLGHKAKDCSEDTVTCFSCGARGHKQEDCKSPMANCWNCGQPGHIKRDCPLKKNVGMCFHCHKVGHHSKNCDMKACYVCGSKDHLYTRCPFKDTRGASAGPPNNKSRRNRRNNGKRGGGGGQPKQDTEIRQQGTETRPSYSDNMFPVLEKVEDPVAKFESGFAFGQELLETQSARSARSSGTPPGSQSNIMDGGSIHSVPPTLRPRSAPLEDEELYKRRPSRRVMHNDLEASAVNLFGENVRPPCTRPRSYGGPLSTRNEEDEALDNLDIMGLLYRDEPPEVPGGGDAAQAWGDIARHQREKQRHGGLPRAPSVETKPLGDDELFDNPPLETSTTTGTNAATGAAPPAGHLRPPVGMFRRGLSVETCAVGNSPVVPPSEDITEPENQSAHNENTSQVSTSPWGTSMWTGWTAQNGGITHPMNAKEQKEPAETKTKKRKHPKLLNTGTAPVGSRPEETAEATSTGDQHSVVELTASVASMDMAESPESLRNTLDVPLPPSVRCLDLAKVDSPAKSPTPTNSANPLTQQVQTTGAPTAAGQAISPPSFPTKAEWARLREELRKARQQNLAKDKKLLEQDRQLRKLQKTVSNLKSAMVSSGPNLEESKQEMCASALRGALKKGNRTGAKQVKEAATNS